MKEVELVFFLEEDVTPEIFANKVAVACARNSAIREGESVMGGTKVYKYTGDTEINVFGGKPFNVPNFEISE